MVGEFAFEINCFFLLLASNLPLFMGHTVLILRESLPCTTMVWLLSGTGPDNIVRSVELVLESSACFPDRRTVVNMLFVLEPFPISTAKCVLVQMKISASNRCLCKRLVSSAASCSIWQVSLTASRLPAVKKRIRRETHGAFTLKCAVFWWPQADF